MRSAWLLSLIVYSLILAGLGTRDGRLLALCLPFVAYLAASLLRSPERAQLQASRVLGANRVGVDMPVDITITITNAGPSLEEVSIEDMLPPRLIVTDGSPRHVLHLPSGATASWTYTVCGPRGYYTFSAIRAQARESLGLIACDWELPAAGQLFILPPVIRLKRVSIRPRRTRVFSGQVPVRAGGIGTEFFGVREYQPGDPRHWINWRVSARHPATLYSNEFEQERVTDVGIVLDGRERAQISAGGRSTFEYATLAAAALADTFLAQGNRVGLLLYGRMLNWTVPGYGKVQLERILRALARAQAGQSEAFSGLDEIPTRLFPARSQLVIVSPLLSTDLEPLVQLRGRGYQVLVISPDPVALEAAALSGQPAVDMAARVIHLRRELMLQRLRRVGVQVIDWDVSEPFEQVMVSQLGRPLVWLRGLEGRS